MVNRVQIAPPSKKHLSEPVQDPQSTWKNWIWRISFLKRKKWQKLTIFLYIFESSNPVSNRSLKDPKITNSSNF